jgi:hypothetical protein
MNIVFKDSDGDPINLTGWTVESQIWDLGRTAKAADWSVAYTNRSQGSIDLSLTDTQTVSMADPEYYYDVLLTDAAGLKEYYLEGTIFMNQGYTR